jgi:predicted NBD/HSP70 family sugar kinase
MRRISPTAFRIARRTTYREINRQIALNLIRSKQPVSRAELARLMGLRRGAVSLLVTDLLRSGLVFEGPKGQSRLGRKPMQLFIETRRRCTLAVDVSASETRVLITDSLGHPLTGVCSIPTPRNPESLVRDLSRAIGRILADHPEAGRCVGVGVSVSGLVEVKTGLLRYSPTLGWRDVDLPGPLKAAINLPVVIENSMKACVLAQLWAVRGDAPVEGALVFVNLSDGVGVGVAVDGRLLRGANNIAGEFGHVTLEPDGPRCSCGKAGCWEAYVSKRATIARYLGTDLAWPASGEIAEPTVETIVGLARRGETRALETLRETGYYLGRGFATIVKAIDPHRIYVAGEVVEAWDLMEASAREALREHALIPEAAQPEIRTVPLGEHPRLRGAAALINTPAFAAPIVA